MRTSNPYPNPNHNPNPNPSPSPSPNPSPSPSPIPFPILHPNLYQGAAEKFNFSFLDYFKKVPWLGVPCLG